MLRALRSAALLAALVIASQSAKAQETVIDNVQELEAISSNLSGNYVLGADINASGYAFTPIGGGNSLFTGSLQGGGYTVDDLSISSTGSSPFGSGLFGGIGSTGSVSNLTLSNVLVSTTGGGSGASVGGLAGVNFGTVTNVSVSGTVSVSAPAGTSTFAGGLVAQNLGTITNSNSSANVSGGVAGGLVGTLNGGSVTQSYATGSVTGVAGNGGGIAGVSAGGLVGVQAISTTAISQSYATGTVSSAGNAGGLVGVSEGSITQSYAAGAVSSSTNKAGGLVGQTFSATITNSYWDPVATGQPNSAGGEPLSTMSLTSGLPPAFDPNVWGSSSSINNGYPYLNPVASGFQAISANFVVPSASASPSQVVQSQQTGLAYMNSAVAAAPNVGTPLQIQPQQVSPAQLLSLLSDLYNVYEVELFTAGEISGEALLTALEGDPAVLIFGCPQNSCNMVLLNINSGSSYVVQDPYEIFSYDLTIQASDTDASHFAVGDEFLINASILDLPSFSEFQVTGINGDNVTFQVSNLASLPDATPLPAALPMFAGGLGLVGFLARRKKQKALAAA